jgi:glycosyltransferase involved in cell wall biosynthesis
MAPYFSFVVPCCNDNSGDLLNRTQIFVTALLEQCRRHKIPSELIIVDWDTPEDQPTLAKALCVPAEPSPCAVRIIEVPAAIRLRNGIANGLAPSQAIAKNVGILRARGRFVLAANIDHPLSDQLMEFIAGQHRRFNALESNDIAAKDGSLMLGAGWFWRELDGSKPFRWFNNNAEISIQPYSDSSRVLAIDIEPGPGVKMGPTTLDVIEDDGSKVLSVRLTGRSVVNIPVPSHNGYPVRLRLRVSDAGHRLSSDPRQLNARVLRCGLYEAPVIARSWKLPQRIWWVLTRSAGSSLLPELEPAERWPDTPHLTAFGDVTMLSRKDWFKRRGYPEFDMAAHNDAGNVSIEDKNGSGDTKGRGAPMVNHREDWGLGTKGLKETLLKKSAPTAPSRTAGQIAVALIEMPFVWFFRSIPRPSLPQPGAFVNSIAAEGPALPLDNPPRISIVTPSYQQGCYLEWTMRSVLEQGYPNLEYVVMDGGSTDETVDILARYKDRLTSCESSPDKGQADAIVRGFGRTTGGIMAYLNSDDLLAPGALDFAARFFAAHPEADAIYSHRVFIDEGNTVTRYWILPPHHTWMMERWDYIPQETCFWRRRIYEKVGGIDPSYHFALDYDLFVRFMQHGRMQRVNRFLGAFREHPSSKTVLQEGAHPEVERVYKERGIQVADWQRLPQLAQFELLDVRSRRFAARGKILPGARAGIGYDYDLVWGGRLNGPRSSSRSSSDIRPI